ASLKMVAIASCSALVGGRGMRRLPSVPWLRLIIVEPTDAFVIAAMTGGLDNIRWMKRPSSDGSVRMIMEPVPHNQPCCSGCTNHQRHIAPLLPMTMLPAETRKSDSFRAPSSVIAIEGGG